VTSQLAGQLDAGFVATLGKGVGAIVLYAIVGLLLMMFGFYAIDFTTPGPLGQLVRRGAPNAVTITSAGLISMALIVVVTIYNSGGNLVDGLLSSLVFGLVGIVVQALGVRVLEWALRLNIGGLLAAETFRPACVAVAAAHFGLGLVVAVSIS
jgi:Domain of Unknown Function (DUF350)